jgi:hypothetical protein
MLVAAPADMIWVAPSVSTAGAASTMPETACVTSRANSAALP